MYDYSKFSQNYIRYRNFQYFGETKEIETLLNKLFETRSHWMISASFFFEIVLTLHKKHGRDKYRRTCFSCTFNYMYYPILKLNIRRLFCML